MSNTKQEMLHQRIDDVAKSIEQQTDSEYMCMVRSLASYYPEVFKIQVTEDQLRKLVDDRLIKLAQDLPDKSQVFAREKAIVEIHEAFLKEAEAILGLDLESAGLERFEIIILSYEQLKGSLKVLLHGAMVDFLAHLAHVVYDPVADKVIDISDGATKSDYVEVMFEKMDKGYDGELAGVRLVVVGSAQQKKQLVQIASDEHRRLVSSQFTH